MNKPCKIVMLQSDQKAVLQLGVNFHYNVPGAFRGSYFNLNVVSEDNVDINDYIVANFLLGKRILKCTNDTFKTNCKESPDMFKKIIASTDPTLDLPGIPEQYIQDWCENPVEDVLVRYFSDNNMQMPLQVNNQISIQVEKTDREKAIAWWNSLSFDQKNYAIKLAQMVGNERLIDYSPDYSYWTGRTIQQLHKTLQDQLCK
jgi:hypothetical protein